MYFSWGYDWGQGGYVYFTRSHGNVCGITSYMVYGTWTPTGDQDDDPAAIPESAKGGGLSWHTTAASTATMNFIFVSLCG